MPSVRTISDCYKLLQVVQLIEKTAHALIGEWAKESEFSGDADKPNLPSPEHFEAQRSLLSAAGLLTELVSDPASRLLEVSSQFNESRALHIVSDLRVPNILAKHDNGLAVGELSNAVGIESRKLGRYRTYSL
jgi:hypothetical protein